MNPYTHCQRKSIALVSGLILCLFAPLAAEEKKDQPARTDESGRPIITEAITVEAKVPRELPFSTTSTVKAEKIETMAARDVAEVLPYSTGTYVSVGGKNEWSVKIRGLEGARSTLLYDGIPVYEPYFNVFDLKSFTAADLDSIHVVKGASSVLYGPNTMGGIVEVQSRRPNPPHLTLRGGYGGNDTAQFGGSGSLAFGNLVLLLAGRHERSDGFSFRRNGESVDRLNSDYKRTNFTGKLYFYPGKRSEILGEVTHFTTDYGVPWALAVYKANYWRFHDWRRWSVNLGGTFPIFARGNLKVRTYYVSHYNMLDAYTSTSLSKLQWTSTYDNHSIGAFALGSWKVGGRHTIHYSLNFRADNVKTQSALNKPWEEYKQNVLSSGVEDNFRLNEKWTVNAGFSVDFLDKRDAAGNDKTRVNPLLGVKFNPTEYIDLHVTLCQKSRFPSMKNLYSATGGNPDLRDERGTNVEVGFTWERGLHLAGAVFYNRIRDLIDKFNLPDGTFLYRNFKNARIRGFELEAGKDFSWLSLSGNYTYLDGRLLTEGRPLDLVPKSQFSAMIGIHPRNWFNLSMWGLAVSHAQVLVSKDIVRVPGYVVANAALEKSFSLIKVYVKVENIFNKAYVTEPGFPMRSRTVSTGVQIDLR